MKDPGLDESFYLLKALDCAPNQSQRGISARLGYSLGKVNFILKAFVKRGFIKMENFTKNDNKAAYRYFLTPEGIKAKYRITAAFLKCKEAEYERLKVEIEETKKLL